MSRMIEIVNNLGFDLSLEDGEMRRLSAKNIYTVETALDSIEEDYQEEIASCSDAVENINELHALIKEHKDKKSSLSKEDLKKVYLMLRDRELHPIGTFDKAGRFYLEDYELVSVRAPSAAYPYSQMNAARTSKFVKAIADKYNCQSVQELLGLFKRA